MLTTVTAFLLVFYAGATAMAALAWIAVRRGVVSFSVLRDVTGIADRTVLRRLFGLTQPDGSYKVSVADVLRHRRRAGVILTDAPVHGLFLVALLWAFQSGSGAGALAVACVAGLHAAIVGGAALVVAAGARQAILD